MNLRKKVLALSAVLAIVAPQAEAAAIFREFSYYTVSGKTAADLDKALSRNGPSSRRLVSIIPVPLKSVSMRRYVMVARPGKPARCRTFM